MIADLARAVAARHDAPAISAAGDLPRRPAHGGAGARAGVLRARHRGAGIPGLGLPALRPGVAACRRGRAAHDRAVAARARQGPRQAVGAADHGQRRAAARAGARLRGDAGAVGRARQRASAWTASSTGSSSTASSAPRPCASPANTRCAAASSTCSRPAWTCRCGSISSATRWKPSAASIRETQRSDDAAARGSISCRWPNSSSPPRRSAASAPAMSRRSAPPIADDLLYEAVSEGRRHPGMEHWLPLFHDRLETLFDYLPGTPVVLEHAGRGRRARAARADRRLLRGAHARRSKQRRRRRPTSRCRRTGSISAKPNGASGSTASALARLTPFAVPDEAAT